MITTHLIMFMRKLGINDTGFPAVAGVRHYIKGHDSQRFKLVGSYSQRHNIHGASSYRDEIRGR